MGTKESFLYLEVDYNHSLQMGDNPPPPHLPFINNHPPPPKNLCPPIFRISSPPQTSRILSLFLIVLECISLICMKLYDDHLMEAIEE